MLQGEHSAVLSTFIKLPFITKIFVLSIFEWLFYTAGHVITGNLNVIPDARVCNIISKGPKYRFPSNIDFPLILISLNVAERKLLLKMTSVTVGVNKKMLNLMP